MKVFFKRKNMYGERDIYCIALGFETDDEREITGY